MTKDNSDKGIAENWNWWVDDKCIGCWRISRPKTLERSPWWVAWWLQRDRSLQSVGCLIQLKDSWTSAKKLCSSDGNAIAVGSRESSAALIALGAKALPLINPVLVIFPNATTCHWNMCYLLHMPNIQFHLEIKIWSTHAKVVQNEDSYKRNLFSGTFLAPAPLGPNRNLW